MAVSSHHLGRSVSEAPRTKRGEGGEGEDDVGQYHCYKEIKIWSSCFLSISI